MFIFNDLIDPEHPFLEADPPPEGWMEIDTDDYRRALFGFPSNIFEQCVEWQSREISRITHNCSGGGI